MAFIDTITADLTAAMRAKDQTRLSTLRMAKAALMNGEVAKGRALEEVEAQQIVASLIKQRRDSVEQFSKGGRDDLVARETAEIAMLEPFLPPPIDAAELAAAVDASIAETGAASAKDMGRVMKAVMSRLAGRTIDGRQVSDLVRQRLGG